MEVIIIMLLHGMPVYFVGRVCRSKDALVAAATISAIVGVFTGSPHWIACDLMAVIAAYGLALTQNVSPEKSEHTDISRFEPKKPTRPPKTREEHKKSARSRRHL